jgi:hypothetical protein
VSSVLPGGALAQLPIAPQIWQEGHRLTPQQTPSVQKPLVHSVPVPQVAPLALVVQPLASQVFGEQIVGIGVGQLPLPSHVAAGVNVEVVVSQELAPQTWVVGS